MARGRITAVMGPAAPGVTLMRHITGQLAPDAGDIFVDGENVPARPQRFALREDQPPVPNSALLTDQRVRERGLPAAPAPLAGEILRNIVLMRLQAVGLRGAAGLMPAELSGGMVRRVALAGRSCATRAGHPDEPFVGLTDRPQPVVKIIRTLTIRSASPASSSPTNSPRSGASPTTCT